MSVLTVKDIILLWKDSSFQELDPIANWKPSLPANEYVKLYGSCALRGLWSREDHLHALGIDLSPLVTWKW